MKQYKEDIMTFLSSKRFVAAVLIIAIISYGFAATNIAINIDDFQTDRYLGSGNDMLKAGRFGMNITYLLRGGRWSNSNSTDIIAVVFLIWAAMNFCVLFRRVSRNNISLSSCTIFAGILISYPLMNEIWEYTDANAVVCVGFFLDSAALLMVYELLHSTEKKRFWLIPVASAAMMWVCAGYESLVPVYIFMVFAILALQIVYGEEKEKLFKEIICQGLIYAAVLVAGILLRVIVHKLILVLFNLEAATNGSAEIYWFIFPPKNVIANLAYGFSHDYIIYALMYFPITELVIAAIVFLVFGIILSKKYGKIIYLPGIGMLFSLVVMSLLWGTCSPYRTCQVFAVFVAFVVLIILTWTENLSLKRTRWIHAAIYIMAAWLCLFQAIYLNHFLTLNYLRSEEEASVVRSVGANLAANYDSEKPVVFVGEYELSDYIVEQASISGDTLAWKTYDRIHERHSQIFKRTYDKETVSRKIPHTNINSVLAWSLDVSGSQKQMQELFAYYGFSFVLADFFTDYPEAVAYAVENEMPIYPKNGYIAERENYIIVRLGEKMPSYEMR